ncbi:Protein N-acetyltransferase, RimJ/RimL family [Filimonas lacunae]|uniref:Protein N-acetyltransferase, RimJ/RimL family n=1 Tax=Filimonas lacunae TaxID=477680 RepID=A0A173MDZ0_9BACT|nr:GNAT family N-acetyltransferase [Filimonas lacunae]BAV05648.1 acetyltransferase [Filimonas lacunae]SIT29057.1 Protein N-acetyltransferase, RimJ/RimL family [Filimonas lacunae]
MEQLPTLTTERLQLTPFTASDIPVIVQYANNPNVSAYTLNMPYPYAEKDAIYWINSSNQGFQQKNNYLFAVRLKETLEFIGGVGLRVEARFSQAELSYWVAEPFWGQGYITEAAQAAIEFGLKILALNKITAHYIDKNMASGKVMEKCGMQKEGELKEHVCKNGVFHNIIMYGITKTDYASMQSSR